eukprot:jgi/Psemu1/8010/gm1.8010_g
MSFQSTNDEDDDDDSDSDNDDYCCMMQLGKTQDKPKQDEDVWGGTLPLFPSEHTSTSCPVHLTCQRQIT